MLLFSGVVVVAAAAPKASSAVTGTGVGLGTPVKAWLGAGMLAMGGAVAATFGSGAVDWQKRKSPALTRKHIMIQQEKKRK